MTDRALQNVNGGLGKIKAPAPGTIFTNRIVHPRNDAVEGAARITPELTRSQRRDYNRELKRLTKQLRRGYYEQLAEQFQHVKTTHAELHKLWLVADTQHERDAINMKAALYKRRAAHLGRKLSDLTPLARRKRWIETRLNIDNAVKARAKLLKKQRAELAKEAHQFAQIIQDAWAALGYCYRYTVKGKEHIQKVEFQEIHITGGDEIWLKIDTTRKKFFTWKITLPPGVKVRENLLSKETLHQLGVMCNRQVTARYEEKREDKDDIIVKPWVIINRLGTRDGIINYCTLEDVLAHYPLADKKQLPIGIGVGRGKKINWIHVTKHPHILIGGSTGGGKSNMLNVLISTLIQTQSPESVQFGLIDMKEGNEFRQYDGIPHLMRPVVTDAEEAATFLEQLETLRVWRSKRFGRYVGVRDLDEWNQVCEDVNHPQDKMPRLIIIFDEFAAIKGVRETEKAIQASTLQLLNKGRAVGIHLILCTQNPSVDVIPGPHKANTALRICGPMPTASASMTVLGTGAAADLPDISGRMLVLIGSKLWPIQVPHARPQDIKNAVDAAHEWPAYDPVALPEARTRVGFSEHDLIETALVYFDGRLGARPIYDLVKHEQNISQRDLGAMVKDIVSRGQIEHEGKQYLLKPFGKGSRLELLETPVLEAENT